MTGGWTAKRFWTTATAEACDGGFTVRLDGKPVKTPLKAPVVVPTLAMATAMAAEWQAQNKKINPGSMPVTRAANSAIDKVVPQFAAIVTMLAAYGDTDLLCYRAERPSALRDRQNTAWDPVLHWLATALSAPLNVTTGVVPIDQPPASLHRLRARLDAMTAFQIVAAHDLIAISGSLVLALAVIDEKISAKAAWTAARTDEIWQSEQWGVDDLAAESEAFKQTAFLAAERFFRLCG